MLPDKLANTIANRVQRIYKENYSEGTVNEIFKILADAIPKEASNNSLWSEEDIIMITYGDSILEPGKSPLEALKGFLKEYLGNTIPCIHILPFFPYSSDDGFSVIDYLKVNPDLGDWQDIRSIAANYDLMADLVINHVSQKHRWFDNFLKEKEPGRDYFIVMDPAIDLSSVIRPRSSPLLTLFSYGDKTVHVWTTFSGDQVDLNFRNPALLIEMIRILVFYLQQGIRIIRLDAIAFLWKQQGTTCLHLPETHEIVKLLRTIGTAINPRFIMLTETNVPNMENLSYFGLGDEAHMVYQFSLPPLLLYTLFSGHAGYLVSWLNSLPEPGKGCTFLNFTASHDGIGVRPLEGLIQPGEEGILLAGMQNNGGRISYKRNADGSESAYEINITYFDALKGTNEGPDNLQVSRFLCSQTIMAGLRGIPAFYIHSILATANDYEGVKETGRARSINRKKYGMDEIHSMLDKDCINNTVFRELKRIIGIRKAHPAFHPDSSQEMMNAESCFVAFKRKDLSTGEIITCISNITGKKRDWQTGGIPHGNTGIDLLTNKKVTAEHDRIRILPYQTIWLKEGPE